MQSAQEQADWDAMLNALDNDDLARVEQLRDNILAQAKKNPSLQGNMLGVRNKPLVLKADEEPFAFAYPSPKEACTLGLFVWMEEPEGDLHLVYVQPDGTKQILWDSAGQEEWIIDLEIDLLPGSGRLEWHSKNGCACTMDFFIEYSEEAGVTGFSAF